MLNNIIIQGRLTKDPELRMTQSEIPVVSYTVAVDRDYSPGGSSQKTDFIECVAWRKTAEFVNRYFRKGQMIVCQGSLQSRKWVDRNDQSRVSWEVQVNNVWFGGDNRKSEDEKPAKFTEVENDGEGDGELPF